jgi:hypothetical protein
MPYDYNRHDRIAARKAALNTGFVCDLAEYGKPSYKAYAALDFHRSFGFDYNQCFEVSSLALAEKLAGIMNRDGSESPIHRDLRARVRTAHMRREIARRDWCAGRAAKTRAAALRVLLRAKRATDRAARRPLLRLARELFGKAASFATTSRSAAENAAIQLELLDPHSARGVAARQRAADLKARIAAFRAQRAAEKVPA